MKKQFSVSDLKDSKAKLEVSIDKSEIKSNYEKILKDVSKKAQIKGFRPGKAPLSVIENKYGEQILSDAGFSLIDEVIKEIIPEMDKKNKPLPYSDLKLEDEESLKVSLDDDFKFSVIYDVMPKFEVPVYKGLEFTSESHSVSKDDLKDALAKIQKENAIAVTKEGPAKEGDIVNIDYSIVNKTGESVSERKNFSFTIGAENDTFIDEDVKANVLNLSANEEKKVELAASKIYKDRTLSIKMNEVSKLDIPALDDDLAQDISSEYKNLKDLEDATKKKLEDQVKTHTDILRGVKILDAMVEKVVVDIPESMIRVELDSRFRQNFQQFANNPEFIDQYLKAIGQTKESLQEQWRDDVIRQIKMDLFLDKVIEAEKIEADQEKVKKVVDEQLNQIEDENMKNMYIDIINDDFKREAAVDFLRENNKFKDKEVSSLEDFLKLEK